MLMNFSLLRKGSLPWDVPQPYRWVVGVESGGGAVGEDGCCCWQWRAEQIPGLSLPGAVGTLPD